MSRPQFRCLRYLNLDLHGLIFEMSVQNWQDQPGFSHPSSQSGPQLARTPRHTAHARAPARPQGTNVCNAHARRTPRDRQPRRPPHSSQVASTPFKPSGAHPQEPHTRVSVWGVRASLRIHFVCCSARCLERGEEEEGGGSGREWAGAEYATAPTRSLSSPSLFSLSPFCAQTRVFPGWRVALFRGADREG